MLKKRNLLFLSLLILGILLITGCTPKLPVLVTFDSQGGSAVNAQTVDQGELVTEPAAPTKTDYTFAGWYKEPGCTNPWDFDSDTVTADMTLYAKWTTTDTYTVTFQKNGAGVKGTMTPQTIASGSSANLKACAFSRTGYTFAGWATTSGGIVKYNDEANYTMGTANVTLYAKWTTNSFLLRDTGPAGGWVFYDKGSYSDGWRYLEAAPASTEWTDKGWGCWGNSVEGTGTDIGTGQSSTTSIVTWLDANVDDTNGDVTNKTNRAAYLCDNLSYGGYDDWFLPSKDELNQMYTNLHNISTPVGGFAGTRYWSSSEHLANCAWSQGFDGGSSGCSDKTNTYRVRAVRAF
jgi:uncharacterized repeat protein (TIGR02543 family)